MTPTLQTVLDSWFRSRAIDIHTAIVAKVTAYDSAKQTVDCQPVTKQTIETETGTASVEFPLLVNVPVCFAGAGGFRSTYPVAQDDFVLVVFSESSIDAWQAGGSQDDNQRRFNLSDAVAIPGLHPNTSPWHGAATDAATIGKDQGPQVVILANEIKLGGHADDPSATHPLIIGDTYRNAEDNLLTSVAQNLTSMAAKLTAAATALTAAATANAVPIVGGALASPGFATVVAQIGLVVADIGSTVASIATMQSGASTYLSTTVKTK